MKKTMTSILSVMVLLSLAGCSDKTELEPTAPVSPITATILAPMNEKEIVSYPLPTNSYQQKFLSLAKAENTEVSFTPDSGDFSTTKNYQTLFNAFFDGKTMRHRVEAVGGYVSVGHEDKRFRISIMPDIDILKNQMDLPIDFGNSVLHDHIVINGIYFKSNSSALENQIAVLVQKNVLDMARPVDMIHFLEKYYSDKGQHLYFQFERDSSTLVMTLSAYNYHLSPYKAKLVHDTLGREGIKAVITEDGGLIIDDSFEAWITAQALIEKESQFNDFNYLVNNGADTIAIKDGFNQDHPVCVEFLGWTQDYRRKYNVYLPSSNRLLEIRTNDRSVKINAGYNYRIRLY